MSAAARMANDNRRSQRFKDDKSIKLKKKTVTKDASPSSTLGPSDTSSLRRSSRETSSRKEMTESPTNARKSERLEKRSPSTPPLKKKSARGQEQKITSPTTRFDRGKKHASSSSLGSKKDAEELASSSKKSKKEKVARSLKQCVVDSSKDSSLEKQGVDVSGRKRKRAARLVYKALVKPQRIQIDAGDDNVKESQDNLCQANSSCSGDVGKELKRPDTLPQLDTDGDKHSGFKLLKVKDDGGDECNDRREEKSSLKSYKRQRRASCSGIRNSDSEVNDQVKVEQSDFRRKSSSVISHSVSPNSCKDSRNSRRAERDFHDVVKEPLDDGLTNLEQAGPVGCLNGKSLDGESIESGNEESSGRKGSSSERETSIGKTDSDTCANIKDNHISHKSSPSGCKRHGHDETCLACIKKPRRNHGSGTQQELNLCDTTSNRDLLNPSSSKDRRTSEAAGLTEIVEKKEALSRTGTTICIACKLGGELRCCDAIGCNRSYHLACLDPPVNDIPVGIWHCPLCTKNIESSFPSVSGVVESIWDTREVEVSDAEGSQKQKQYFVKYKDLAHIHNQWVAENQLLLEAPSLVANFSKNDMLMKWTVAWTVPHQLLKKRLLLSFKPQYQSQQKAGKFLNYHYEWLVKWQGLDSAQATWESGNTSALISPEGRELVKKYEKHHGKAKTSASPVDETEELPFKLPTIPAGCLPGMDTIHLSYVKNLHDAWNKGQNSVIFDDQERTMRVILLILSLKDVTLPFLLITTSGSLSQWEDMFLRVAPCNDFKVSIEDLEGQRSAKLLKVQKEGGQLAFQVLLCPVDTFVKDLNVLKAIEWEAVIVDESQSKEISSHFNHIKGLSTDKRLLVYCGPLGVSIAGYLNVLSQLLGCDGALSSVTSKTESDDISKLKETLSRFIAYDSKSSSSKFVEFWVPVQISNVQLEQYCSTLLSNAMALNSCSKSDTVGALHDILVSNRKCCDHPYIVDQLLQSALTKDLEPAKFLDVGIKASGKLQFLDMMLPEMKKRNLRVLILFQPLSGSGRDSTSIGDILDDFVRQRFGEDSYERVDGIGTVPSKKQAALNNFNNKEKGRFIFLLEYRACLPSIKLSSVDSIIIFDSEWNPANDVRALQKVTIDSKSEQIMIFRLYTSWTLEEKVLRLAEQNVTIDSKLQNLSRSTSDALLMWGAPYLFDRLAEFHSLNISSEESFWNELLEEFVNLISHKFKGKDTAKSIITRVHQSCGIYSKHLPSPKTQLLDGEKPHTFWRKLLEGKNPRWKYLSLSTPRQRKRPQYFEESPSKTNAGDDNVGSKRKKIANNLNEPAAIKPVIINAGDDDVGSKHKKTANNVTESAATKPVIEKGDSGDPPSDESQMFPGGSIWSAAIHDESSFRHLLKLNISKLCKVLKLSEDIKIMVERFLEYVIENYRVNKEPANTLQAFLISLCWIGSALLKHKLDRRQSLALAKKHLHFSCTEEETNSVYSKLKPAKDMFLRHTETQKETDDSRDCILTTVELTSTQPLDPKVSKSDPLNPQGEAKVEDLETTPDNQCVDDERTLMELGQSKIRKLLNKKTSLFSKKTPSESEMPKESSDGKNEKERGYEDVRILLELGRSEIRKLLNEESLPSERDGRKENVAGKKKEEIEKFNKQWDEKKVLLENGYKVDKDFICMLHQTPSERSEKLKSLENVFANKLEEHERQREICLKDLKAMQLAVERWAAALADSSTCEPPLNGFGSEHENLIVVSEDSEPEGQDSPKNTLNLSANPTEVVSPNGSTSGSVHMDPNSSSDTEEIPAKKHKDISTGVSKKVNSAETRTLAEGQNDTGPNDAEGPVGSVGCNQENADGGSIVDDAHSSGSSHSASVAASKDKVPAVQPVSPASEHLVPANPEIQNESVQGEEVQDNPSSPAKIGNLDKLNSEDPPLEPHEEPANAAVLENQSNIPPASEPEPEITHQEPTPTLPAEPQPDLHSVNRVDCQPLGEPQNPAQNPEAPPQDARLPGPNLLNIQQSDNHNQAAARHPFSPDPLQAEMEKLCEVNNNVVKYHEDIKLKLKSEHEKELAETIAQINRKYEAKRQEAEAAFRTTRKELEMSLNRVVMNKMLAEAFRSKCQDFNPSDAAGMQQATQSGFIQHMRHLLVRRSTGAASSSPSGGQQVAGWQPPLQIVHQPAQLFSTPSTQPPPSYTTTPRPPPTVNPSTPRPQPVVRPITTSTAPRPPPTNPTTPSTTPRPQPVARPITAFNAPRPPPTNPTTPSTTPRPQPVARSITASNAPRPPPTNHTTPSTTPRPQPVARPITASNAPRPPPTNPTTPSTTPRPQPFVRPITASSAPRPLPVNPTTTSNTPRPPPTINPITARNLRANGEIRAPAPHIRPFSPPVLTHHRAMPSQHPLSNLPPPTTTSSQSSPQPPLPPPPPPVAPPATSSLPPPPPVSNSHTSLYTSFPTPETGANILTLPAFELLMNVDDWADGYPPPPDSPGGKEGGAPPKNSLSGDLVCLSDDD